MAKERLTDAERAEIQKLIVELYEAWEPPAGVRKSWAAFARHVGVSEYSLTDWRAGRGTPAANNLIKILRAGGKVSPMSTENGAEPVGLMREALANQAQNRRETTERLAEIHALLEALVNGQTAMLDVQTRLLELFQAEQSRRRASPEQ